MKTICVFFMFIIAAFHSRNSSAQAPNTWTQKADLGGIGRYDAVGFSIGTKGYIGTGWDYYGFGLNDFWQYDTNTNAWTQKANFGGVSRCRAVGFSIGTKGYIGTGLNVNEYNDFWEYDPSTNSWTQKTNFGGTARQGAIGFSIGTKGYIGTGWDVNLTNDLWEYDPGLNTWTQKANFPGSARWAAVGFSIGAKGYVGTGLLSNTGFPSTDDFWEYDPATNSWTQKANFAGGPRFWAVGFSINTKGYIGTGVAYDQSERNDFWEYDPSNNSWTQRADVGGGNHNGAVGMSIGYKGYIGTGIVYSGFPSQDFWQYTTACNLPPPPTNTTPIGNQSICIGNSTTLSVSGSGTLGWYNAATGGTWLGGGNTFITPTLITNTTYFVQDSNTCGASLSRTSIPITVYPYPVPTITGPNNVCVNSGYYFYFTEPGMTNYLWSISPGGTIISGQGTNILEVIWPQEGNQLLSVNYINGGGCTANQPTQFPVTANPLPDPAGAITGSPVVCAGSEGIGYSVYPIQHAIAYVWTLPVGATIISGIWTNSITVDFADNAFSGNITVYGNNLCGNGTTSPNFYVSIKPIPPTPMISEIGNILYSSAPVGNQWFYNNILLVNDTNQTYQVSPYLPGWYWTQITLDGCISDTSNHIFVDVTEINKRMQTGLILFPNPAKDFLLIELKYFNNSTKFIEIYDQEGKKIFDSQTKENKILIDVKNYSSGIFFVILVTSDSKYIGKFCKD